MKRSSADAGNPASKKCASLLRDNDDYVKRFPGGAQGQKNGLQRYRAKRISEQAVITTDQYFIIV